MLSPVRESGREREKERDVHACNSLFLSLTSEQGVHTLFTSQRESEKERQIDRSIDR